VVDAAVATADELRLPAAASWARGPQFGLPAAASATRGPELRSQRYELGEPLGQGGQGRTFRALDRERGRAVAVKVMELGAAAGGWKSFDLFERECQVLRGLAHAAIPRYLDTFAVEAQGRYFLVMELCEGVTLRRLLEEKRTFSEGELWSILHQVLEVLDYLHGRRPPVIHRDIKPANLILRPDSSVALVDFGGVRLALRPDGGSTVVGTFGYMAPEQLHGEATPATDLYALGATIAALASGSEPEHLPRRGLRIDLDAVLPPSSLRELLARLLEPDPTARPQSVAAVRELLAGAAAGEPLPRAPDAEQADAAQREVAELAGGIGGPFGLVIRLFGSLGYVGLLLLDVMVLPVVVFALSTAWAKKPKRLARLREHEALIRRAVRSGRRTMKALARSRERQRELPPHQRDRELPPHRRRGRG
jgi:hypothetical protein